jgi:hypothetical protein
MRLSASLVAVAAVCTACGTARPHAAAPHPVHPVVVIDGADLSLLEDHYPRIVEEITGSSNAYVVGDPDGHQDEVPPGSRAHPTLAYTSYARFARDATTDRIDPIVDTVIYDPEGWSQTPLREQRDPHRYIRLFIRLAHQAGFTAIVSPGRDLALGARGCHKRRGEPLDAAYLRCRYAADAVGADMIMLQTGADELTAGGLRRFLAKAVAQIRRAQPRVALLGVITTEPTSHTRAWPAGLLRATRIQLRSLGGFSLNFTAETAPLAADYLRDAERDGALRRRGHDRQATAASP